MKEQDPFKSSHLLIECFLNLSLDFELAETELAQFCSALCALTSDDEKLTFTINELIRLGCEPNTITSALKQSGFDIPDSAYLDWRLHDKLLAKPSLLGSFSANASAMWNSGIMRWMSNNATPLIGLLSTYTMFANMVTPAAAASPSNQCLRPDGSYLKTCDVTGQTYQSTDPNLANIHLCKFNLDCKKMSGEKRHSDIYLPANMKDCLGYLENCNGHPVIRTTQDRVCVSEKAAMAEMRRLGKGEL